MQQWRLITELGLKVDFDDRLQTCDDYDRPTVYGDGNPHKRMALHVMYVHAIQSWGGGLDRLDSLEHTQQSKVHGIVEIVRIMTGCGCGPLGRSLLPFITASPATSCKHIKWQAPQLCVSINHDG